MEKNVLTELFLPNMSVSENRGTPKSSILIRISIINHPFWGTTILGNTHMYASKVSKVGHWLSKAYFLVDSFLAFEVCLSSFSATKTFLRRLRFA